MHFVVSNVLGRFKDAYLRCMLQSCTIILQALNFIIYERAYVTGDLNRGNIDTDNTFSLFERSSRSVIWQINKHIKFVTRNQSWQVG